MQPKHTEGMTNGAAVSSIYKKFRFNRLSLSGVSDSLSDSHDV